MATSQTSARKWFIEEPQVLPSDDPSFLCAVCRHINFKYLIYDAPLFESFEEIPLDTYASILSRQECAFCRLMKKTIDNILGEDAGRTEHEGKAVKISMISAWIEMDGSRPRQLLLWMKPDPSGAKETPPLFIQNVQVGSWLDCKGKGRVWPSGQIDFLLVLYWNRVCRVGEVGVHKDSGFERTDEESKLPVGFRLIDTKRNCIVPAQPEYEYIALSYVWGKGESLRLLNENFAELAEDGALIKHGDRIPQTIKDAMYMVTKMFDRYLWVDALCIIQDNAEDKMAQILAMDRIYGSSVLTIAATHGEDANAGLPGVRRGTRKMIQGIETIQGICLANRPWSFDKSVSDSKWNSRAWTLQERILTKRTLFITSQQMFFKCEHAEDYLAEDVDTKLKHRKPVTSPMNDTGKDTIPQKWSINIVSYQRTVESFVKRDITYLGDVLNAFGGLAQKMRPMFRGQFLYGLPQTEMECCMLWESWGGTLVRRRDPDSGRALFPSWSWAGWVGPVTYNWTEKLSRIKWVDESESGSSKTFTSDEYRAPLQNSAAWRDEWTEKRTGSGSPYYYHAADPDCWFHHPVAPEADRSPRLGPQCQPGTDGHLRFWAWTTDIKFPEGWKAPHDVQGPIWQLSLVDKKGYSIGYFRVPIEVLPSLGSTGKLYDVVIIARTRHGANRSEIRTPKVATSDAKKKSERDEDDDEKQNMKALEDYVDEDDMTAEENFFPDELETQHARFNLGFDRQRYNAYKPFCLYEFLFVEWDGEIAHRIGIGKVHIDAWAKEERVWKLITLA